MTELALICFDGLDPRVIKDNVGSKGRMDLPNFTDLLHNSMHGKWRTPGHTIPSYIATLTGKQYNVVNFHWDEGKGAFQRHRQTGYDFLWEYTDSSMTLLNMPVLYPPEDIDDAMVCGFLAPDDLADSNLTMNDQVRQILLDNGYIHDVNADETYSKLGGAGMLDRLYTMMSKRADAAEELISALDSDLFYGVWTAPDRWFHQCHLHNEAYKPMYEFCDEILGRMMKIIPRDIPLMVFSDHGFAHFPRSDDGVHKGHMYEGFYSIRYDGVPNYEDNSASIFDVFPTVLNYLDGGYPDTSMGRVLFHPDEQSKQVEERLDDLGYLD